MDEIQGQTEERSAQIEATRRYAITRIDHAGFTLGSPGTEGWTMDEVILANEDFLGDEVSGYLSDAQYNLLGDATIRSIVSDVAKQYS